MKKIRTFRITIPQLTAKEERAKALVKEFKAVKNKKEAVVFQLDFNHCLAATAEFSETILAELLKDRPLAKVEIIKADDTAKGLMIRAANKLNLSERVTFIEATNGTVLPPEKSSLAKKVESYTPESVIRSVLLAFSEKIEERIAYSEARAAAFREQGMSKKKKNRKVHS